MCSNAQRIAAVRSMIESFNTQDAAGILARLSPDVRRSRGSGGIVQGREAIAERLKSFFYAFPDATLSKSSMLALPSESLLVEWTLEATHTGDWKRMSSGVSIAASGLRLSCSGADLFGFNSRCEVESIESRADTASFLQPIGESLRAEAVRELAERYTRAWCSGDPSLVAACYGEAGSLTINSGVPSCGRAAIEEAARSFMTAFPGMIVRMDDLLTDRDRAVYRWTLEGVNHGPGGTGRSVCISGFEVWNIGSEGLIAESRGYFDTAAYADQLRAR